MHFQRSIAKAKRKQQNFRNISDNGNLDWLLHQNVFSFERVKFHKGKDSHLRNYLESPLTELPLNLITRKSLC